MFTLLDRKERLSVVVVDTDVDLQRLQSRKLSGDLVVVKMVSPEEEV